MKFGISLPPFGDYAEPLRLAETAWIAEETGWDGFFIWDHVFFDPSFHPMIDPWVGLAAVASHTTRIRIGALVTPIARRRPWILARQTVAVDRFSNGRLIFGAGLGESVRWDFGFLGEETDNKRRAEKLDEGLEIINGLWSGELFRHAGKHYQVQEVRFLPGPAQSPRIPVWIGGQWPNRRPMRRAARWDGYFPLKWETGMQVEDWREALGYIRQHRTAETPFDAVHAGRVPETQWSSAAAIIEPYAGVGVTWWIEDVSPWRFGHSWEITWQPDFAPQMDEIIRRGPPRL